MHSNSRSFSGSAGGAGFESDAMPTASSGQRTGHKSAALKSAAAVRQTGASAETGRQADCTGEGQLSDHSAHERSNQQDAITITMAGATGHKGTGRKSTRGVFHCTRTRWAVGIAAVLLVAAGIAAGVGVYLTVGRNKQGMC